MYMLHAYVCRPYCTYIHIVVYFGLFRHDLLQKSDWTPVAISGSLCFNGELIPIPRNVFAPMSSTSKEHSLPVSRTKTKNRQMSFTLHTGVVALGLLKQDCVFSLCSAWEFPSAHFLFPGMTGSNEFFFKVPQGIEKGTVLRHKNGQLETCSHDGDRCMGVRQLE